MPQVERRLQRLPFFYGWLIIGVAFATVAVAVTARTAFSLMLPPMIEEFGWERGLTSGAFSFGFFISALLSPFVGKLIDRRGPRFVIEIGVVLLAAGLACATLIRQPWHLYASLGLLVSAGANCMTYTVQSQYLPNWFVRRRGLAMGIAFAGVGAGAITLLPWLQSIIQTSGWRTACGTMAALTLVLLAPLNLLVRKRPEDVGLLPDGDAQPVGQDRTGQPSNIVDASWVAVDWTLARALRTGRYWWIIVSYFNMCFVWYLVQIHQTKYLIEIGFEPMQAAWALGLVAAVAVPGQIGLGALSDRIGREWVWSIACLGFAICCVALMALEHAPSLPLLYVMVVSQGLLGYAVVAIMGPIVAEIFEGPQFGAIFGTVSVALIGGGAAGPVVAGLLHDATGNYRLAFGLSIACCAISTLAIWCAAPRHVRCVPGRMRAAT